MPRFSLREFSQPDYVSTLPKADPNDALWPRISMLAKMLNEIPWFKKKEKPDYMTELTRDQLKAAYEEDMAEYDPSAQRQAERNSRLMDGYVPAHAGPTPPPEEEPVGVENVDLLGFDPQTASKKDIRKMQKELASGGGDLGKSGADGVWGAKTQKAYEEYNRKLAAAEQMKMRGYDRTPSMLHELDEAEQWADRERER